MLEELLFSKFDEISIYWRSKRSADKSIQKFKQKLMMEAASLSVNRSRIPDAS